MPRCDLHHLRRAFIWHEHEPCSDVRSGFCRSSLDRALDLLHCASACNAAGRARLSTNEAHSLLRQVSSLQPAALHFQLPIPRIAGSTTDAEANAQTRDGSNVSTITHEPPPIRITVINQRINF